MLNSIPQWIDDQLYDASIFQYGIPPHLKHLIDKPLCTEVTYTDAICLLQAKLPQPIQYLELGVSVGKNFLQVASFLENGSLTGFDIEEINPALEAQFSGKTVDSRWATPDTSMKKGGSSMTSYRFQTNQVHYLSGDVFDESAWARLAGQKFNVIFSDAFHSPEALRLEHEMIRKYELLESGNFIMLWDDLGGEMTNEFLKIFQDMQTAYNLTADNLAVNSYRGWMGEYVPKHMIGMIYRF